MKEQEFLQKKPRYNDEGIWIDEVCIMFKWEKEAIEESIKLICDKVKPYSVLELGFGYGYTAEQFQKCGVRKHVIIEPHPEIYKKAVEWANKRPCKHICVLNSFWQDVDLPQDEFDLIYFDTFEMVFDDNTSWKTKFKTKWLSEVFLDEPLGKGFRFKINGKEYFQPLVENGGNN